MSKTYRLYQVDAFTREKFTGNPAGVITNADGLTDGQMQRIARELRHSETAFLFEPPDDTCDVRIRFFTPTREVPICGHATVAAHYARARENALAATRVWQKTGAGILPVDIAPVGGDYRITMTQGTPAIEGVLPEGAQETLAAALGVARRDIPERFPVAIATTGHSKVMVALRDPALLHGLRPDMARLAALSGEIGCNGFYAFTLHPGETPLIHGRMFAPAIGIDEDPVTGNANGPLGAYLVHYGLAEHDGALFAFQAMQGEALGRTGTMDVRVHVREGRPREVQIVGDAVIVYSAELTL
ncbi:MAG: PhzF family isomerase [Clostridiales bacterium]|nr:PhzF family isomerase [Clostridiales bacterium]